MLLLDEKYSEVSHTISWGIVLLPFLGVFMILAGMMARQFPLIFAGLLVGNLGLLLWFLVRGTLRREKPLLTDKFLSDVYPTKILRSGHTLAFHLLLFLCGFRIYTVLFSDEPSKAYVALGPASIVPTHGRLHIGELKEYNMYWIE